MHLSTRCKPDAVQNSSAVLTVSIFEEVFFLMVLSMMQLYKCRTIHRDPFVLNRRVSAETQVKQSLILQDGKISGASQDWLCSEEHTSCVLKGNPINLICFESSLLNMPLGIDCCKKIQKRACRVSGWIMHRFRAMPCRAPGHTPMHMVLHVPQERQASHLHLEPLV